MTITNKTYDILKWVAIVVLPATATLVTTICRIWGYAEGDNIAATITAVSLFLGVILGVSTLKYNKKQGGTNDR